MIVSLKSSLAFRTGDGLPVIRLSERCLARPQYVITLSTETNA